MMENENPVAVAEAAPCDSAVVETSTLETCEHMTTETLAVERDGTFAEGVCLGLNAKDTLFLGVIVVVLVLLLGGWVKKMWNRLQAKKRTARDIENRVRAIESLKVLRIGVDVAAYAKRSGFFRLKASYGGTYHYNCDYCVNLKNAQFAFKSGVVTITLENPYIEEPRGYNFREDRFRTGDIMLSEEQRVKADKKARKMSKAFVTISNAIMRRRQKEKPKRSFADFMPTLMSM